MNAKRRSLILTATVLILALSLAACGRWGLDGAPAPSDIKPSTPTTPATPVPSAMPSGGVELTVLASGSGVTILEYQGAGVRCIIASGTSVDMVCQNSATVPVQPTPTGPDKQQTPNGSSEA
jgi:predicted small lipoprotein YifL